MRVRERSFKQQLFFAFLVSFFIGIVLSNLLGTDSFQKNGNLTRYYLNQFQYVEIRSSELLWHVLSRRLPIFALLMLIGTIPKSTWVHWIFVVWSGFAYGYFCVMAISGFGAKGLLLCLGALIPHFFLYVPVYVGLVELTDARRERKRWRFLVALSLLLLGFFAGMLLESYINPVILKKMLNLY